MKIGKTKFNLTSVRRLLIREGAPALPSPYGVVDAYLSMKGVARARSKKQRVLQAMQIATGNEYGRPAVPLEQARRPSRRPRRTYSPPADTKKAFYASWEWRTLRMEVLKEHGHRCQSCGATPTNQTISGEPVRIVVDHIKPLSKYWNLRLDRRNLQVLCDECNMGKGAWDETDYRPANDDQPEPEDETDPLTREWREIIG